MKTNLQQLGVCVSAAILAFSANHASASSHMDAPLITLDDAANTTDVYAFRSQQNGIDYLTTALAVYPFEEPGIGPNIYNFDDNVRYSIRVALQDDFQEGRPTLSYHFDFKTRYKNENTILQSYLGVINDVDDANQNLTQTYTVKCFDHRTKQTRLLGSGVVPPNNQGIATPKYNQDDYGNNPAKEGVAYEFDLDPYTSQSISALDDGYIAFAGQRDDGFYGDIQSIFDLLQIRNPGKDSQGGFNVHTIVLDIPLGELSGNDVVGVWGTTQRQRIRVFDDTPFNGVDDNTRGRWIQVGRQGNPLFNEALVAIEDKDSYNRTSPRGDDQRFRTYAENPELARLLNALVIPGSGLNPADETGRVDIAGIFIPDVIKVFLGTPPVRLAGGGANHPTNPDDEGFSPLSIFGGDVLTVNSQFGDFTVPGGWPNGRRFGDDVVDIAVTGMISDLRVNPPIIQGPIGDNVDSNDIAYNKVFPYAATPLNGRNHQHD